MKAEDAEKLVRAAEKRQKAAERRKKKAEKVQQAKDEKSAKRHLPGMLKRAHEEIATAAKAGGCEATIFYRPDDPISNETTSLLVDALNEEGYRAFRDSEFHFPGSDEIFQPYHVYFVTILWGSRKQI